MDNDIIIEVAKRTKTEVIEQIKEVPIVAAPFVFAGIIFSPVILVVVILVAVLALIAHNEYKAYEQELIMNDLQTPSVDPLNVPDNNETDDKPNN